MNMINGENTKADKNLNYNLYVAGVKRRRRKVPPLVMQLSNGSMNQ